jgi:hypothetical protein
MTESREGFEENVFINCPFDVGYHPLLQAMLFTIAFLGFRPRIALERFDSGELRLSKIAHCVKESRFSIHDLSRLQAGAAGEYYRLNMPFELGIEYGGRLFGRGRLREKRCLVLESEPFDAMRALSDLAGVDVKSYRGEPFELMRQVRNWFVECAALKRAPAPVHMWSSYSVFTTSLNEKLPLQGFTRDDVELMPVAEYLGFIQEWLREQSLS